MVDDREDIAASGDGSNDGVDEASAAQGADDAPADGQTESAEEQDSAGAKGRREWEWPFSDVQEIVGDILGGFRSATPVGGRFPRFDLIQLPEEGYLALIDLPGLERSQIDVTTVGDQITISGKRSRPELPEGAEVIRSERGYGRFRREIRLPSDVDATGIRAKLEDGVLSLTLPRRTEAEKIRVEIEE